MDSTLKNHFQDHLNLKIKYQKNFYLIFYLINGFIFFYIFMIFYNYNTVYSCFKKSHMEMYNYFKALIFLSLIIFISYSLFPSTLAKNKFLDLTAKSTFSRQ